MVANSSAERMRSNIRDNRGLWGAAHTLLDSQGLTVNNPAQSHLQGGRMSNDLVFLGVRLQSGAKISTDVMTPTHIMFKT
jgi:hypothetical protein